MKRYTLTGHPLGHTLSPPIHKRLFELSRVEGDYGVTDLPSLGDGISLLKSFDGYNVTIPYKTEIIGFLDALDDSAKRYGAVNCVKNHDGTATGYNTDCTGFLRSIESEGLSLGGKVLLLGCGGAGRMMATETLLAGGELTIAVRDVGKGRTVADEISASCGGKKINVVTLGGIDGTFDVCLNSTPVGMFPDIDSSPVSDSVAERCGAVFDAIYNPDETVLMKQFSSRGKTAVGGMAMLVWQAVAAHEIWNGSSFDTDDISKLIEEMNNYLKK